MAAPISSNSSHAKLFAIPIGMFVLLAICGVDSKIAVTLALGGCLLITLIKAGIEFSADYRSYREYYSLFGMRFGAWKRHPSIVGVTIKYFSETASTKSHKYSWNDTPAQHKKLIVMLSVENKSDGIIIGDFSLNDVNSAIDFAHDIAEGFGVPVHLFLPSNQFKPL